METNKVNLTYRQGTFDDLPELKSLAIKSWGQFQPVLTEENWAKLYAIINDDKTYKDLLNQSNSIVCVSTTNKIIGMAFLVPNGNPTDIYENGWSYIRFVSVDPEFGGQGIGKKLTKGCINTAKKNGEKIIALHTSEIMDKARHIYESLGFKVLREIDQRLGKKYWLYKLELS